MEESQGQATPTYFPEQVRKHCRRYEANRNIYAWMAELLQHCRYEEQHRKPQWMAVQEDTDVHLETVETGKDA